jgi:NMD protein affecting ribosome stability and mRNA decay
MRIDVALQHKLDMARKCSKCGAPLPLRYPYGLCPDCYAKRAGEYNFRPRNSYRQGRRRH